MILHRQTPIGNNYSVPDTCCHTITKDCGKDIFRKQDSEKHQTIFIVGCLTILKDRLRDDVIPMMIVYACVGVLLALVELITVVLACAYIAQISRKRRREDQMWRHTGGGNDDETDNLRSSRGETVC